MYSLLCIKCHHIETPISHSTIPRSSTAIRSKNSSEPEEFLQSDMYMGGGGMEKMDSGKVKVVRETPKPQH